MLPPLTLIPSQETGRGDRRSLCVLIVLLFAAVAHAQTASLPIPVYRPGRYVPLRLTADAPGTVRVRGDGVQGIDWPARGRGSVVVPLLIYGDADGPLRLTIDGHPTTLDLHALGDVDPDPPDLTAFWQNVDPLPPAGPAFDEDAYETAALWRPGRAAASLRWALTATAVVVLVLGVATYVDPPRTTLWLCVAALGLTLGILRLFPTDAPRRVLAADGQPGWDWVWAAALEPRPAYELWAPGQRFVPRSATQLKEAAPLLVCDRAGRPVIFAVTLSRGGRAVFIRPAVRRPSASGPSGPPASEK